ncbi:guanylate kinase [Actinophytocola oryzae]|uniref:Guanylate kinase n=1 Tax=Actinophytocola oryzae TaxID=502181 RepID=A0A4R7VIN3_9PSEU|nr:guanylate kinase [Actinophytocola oryzae]TDV48989.1 guanylate kinase [Actinophytocola oryzae]
MTRNANRRGRLVVLAGPSGVGKSSVVHELRKLYPDLWFSVSATTRDQRPGELDGVDYRFVTADEFDRMIKNDDLLEWAEIHRGIHRSGTPRAPIEDRLAAGEPALVEVDLQGARNLREAMPEAYLVFLSPPSWDALVERLVQRGTEAPEVVERRLRTAKEELAAQSEFDAVVVNTDVRSAARDLLKLILDKSSDQLENH